MQRLRRIAFRVLGGMLLVVVAAAIALVAEANRVNRVHAAFEGDWPSHLDPGDLPEGFGPTPFAYVSVGTGFRYTWAIGRPTTREWMRVEAGFPFRSFVGASWSGSGSGTRPAVHRHGAIGARFGARHRLWAVPYDVRVPELLGNLLIMSMLVHSIATAVTFVLFRSRRKAQHCAECGYGPAVGGTCPECGGRVNRSHDDGRLVPRSARPSAGGVVPPDRGHGPQVR